MLVIFGFSNISARDPQQMLIAHLFLRVFVFNLANKNWAKVQALYIDISSRAFCHGTALES